eukprot:jgi/Psemu1/286711/fgenesh1_pg.150_\
MMFILRMALSCIFTIVRSFFGLILRPLVVTLLVAWGTTTKIASELQSSPDPSNGRTEVVRDAQQEQEQEQHRCDCQEEKNDDFDDNDDWNEEDYIRCMNRQKALAAYREATAYLQGMEAAATALTGCSSFLPPPGGAVPSFPMYTQPNTRAATTAITTTKTMKSKPRETRDQMRKRVAREMKQAAAAGAISTPVTHARTHSSRNNRKKRNETKTEMRLRVAHEMTNAPIDTRSKKNTSRK